MIAGLGRDDGVLPLSGAFSITKVTSVLAGPTASLAGRGPTPFEGLLAVSGTVERWGV